jgi:hypothetical protein
MEAKSIQLYQLAHKKLHLGEKDAMEFVDVIQETIEDRTKNFWMGQLVAMFGFLYLFLKH